MKWKCRTYPGEWNTTRTFLPSVSWMKLFSSNSMETALTASLESAKQKATHEISTRTFNDHMINLIKNERISEKRFFFLFVKNKCDQNWEISTIVPAQSNVVSLCCFSTGTMTWREYIIYRCAVQAMPTQKQRYAYRRNSIRRHIHAYRGRCVKIHWSAITVKYGCTIRKLSVDFLRCTIVNIFVIIAKVIFSNRIEHN